MGALRNEPIMVQQLQIANCVATALTFRFLLTDSLALHVDFRDHLFDIDLLGEEKTAHNLEGHIGVTVFF